LRGNDNLNMKARELVLWFESRQRLPELIAYCRLRRLYNGNFPRADEAVNALAIAHQDDDRLALCGLALAQQPTPHTEAAIAAYREARAIFRGAGTVGRMLRLLDQLALVGPLPPGVRAAAAGEPPDLPGASAAP
jgi:hypothetical protein